MTYISDSTLKLRRLCRVENNHWITHCTELVCFYNLLFLNYTIRLPNNNFISSFSRKMTFYIHIRIGNNGNYFEIIYIFYILQKIQKILQKDLYTRYQCQVKKWKLLQSLNKSFISSILIHNIDIICNIKKNRSYFLKKDSWINIVSEKKWLSLNMILIAL